jgi:hypothetical protein
MRSKMFSHSKEVCEQYAVQAPILMYAYKHGVFAAHDMFTTKKG